jgi:hypothetical protein
MIITNVKGRKINTVTSTLIVIIIRKARIPKITKFDKSAIAIGKYAASSASLLNLEIDSPEE